MFNSCKNNYEDDELFECQTNGIISDSIVRNWTQQALDCYKLNSVCANCPIANSGYSFKCQMKHVVDILLKTQGLPDEKSIIESQTNIANNDIVA